VATCAIVARAVALQVAEIVAIKTGFIGGSFVVIIEGSMRRKDRCACGACA